MSRMRILLLEDSLLDAELTKAMLIEGGFEFEAVRVETREEFVRELGKSGYDLILADYALPTFDGLSALQLAHKSRPDLPFIFVSGTLGEDLAIESLRNGATDYVLKQRLQRLVPCVQRALQEKEEQRELKHAHEALVVSEKLAVVGRLAATIAHEINNPLAAVTNLLYLLESNDSLDNNARNLLNIANRELARVAEISRQTLSFYRESSYPVDVRLDQVITSADVLLRRKLNDASITLELDLRAETPMPGYPGEMRQLFSNLISNAMEAMEAVPASADTAAEDSMPRKIKVRVRAGRDPKTGAQGLRATVADNGPGIASETLPRIFEPFFTTKGERGTGLGLWVSQGIIAKHRGSLRVRSSVRPGHSGTTFTIFFRLAQAIGGQTEENRTTSTTTSMVA